MKRNSPERITEARQLAERGFSRYNIAVIMGTTTKSVEHMLNPRRRKPEMGQIDKMMKASEERKLHRQPAEQDTLIELINVTSSLNESLIQMTTLLSSMSETIYQLRVDMHALKQGAIQKDPT